MKCEVKNVQSAEVFAVPPEGMVFGRAGGPANITVSDQSVSKRHARIYLKEGTWVLEDLKSVNGTVVNNRRITEPVPIAPGFVFALSKHQFEIVTADGAQPAMGTRSSGPRGSSNGRDNGRDPGRDAVAAEGPPAGSDPRRAKAASQRPQRPGGPSQPVQVPDAEPLLPPEPSNRRPAPPQAFDDPGEDAQQDAYLDEAVQGGGAGAVLAALPKAVAYYLAAVPLMALNPLGTIRRGAEEPKLKAMGPLELIAFILPVQIFGNLLTAWAAGIGTLIGGGGFVFSAFFPIVQLVVAVVVSVVSGFVTHPLGKFFIDRLFKGESNDKTRTNYVIMTQTAYALLAIPTAVTLLLEPVIVRLSASIAPIALLLIIPALLRAVTSPLIPLVAWTWMKAFRVLPIIQKILFVLLILSVIGGVALAGQGILYAVQRMTSGPSVGTVGTVDTIDPEEAAKAAVAAAKAAGIDGDALKKIEEDARTAAELAKKAALEAKAKDPPKDPAKDEPKDDKDPGKDEPKDPKDAKDPPKDEPKDPPKDEPKDPPKDEPKDPPKDEPKDPPRDASIKEPVEDAPRGSGAFSDYKKKRDFVEQAIANDPSLLKNDKVSDAYRKLSRQTYLGIAEAESDVLGKKKRYDPELKLYLERYKELKIYERTKGLVDELYKLLRK